MADKQPEDTVQVEWEPTPNGDTKGDAIARQRNIRHALSQLRGIVNDNTCECPGCSCYGQDTTRIFFRVDAKLPQNQGLRFLAQITDPRYNVLGGTWRIEVQHIDIEPRIHFMLIGPTAEVGILCETIMSYVERRTTGYNYYWDEV